MALSVATLIDRAKGLADKRADASIPDTDWVTYINWSLEDLYRLIVNLDTEAYFQTIDFTLTGGASGSTFNLDLAFDVRLYASSLPAFTPSGTGPGHTLTASVFGALTVDGTAAVLGDRILYGQTGTGAGIYNVLQVGNGGAPWILIRATDFDQLAPTEVQIGAVVTVTAGTGNTNAVFVLTTLTGAPDIGSQTWTNLPLYTRFRALHGLDLNPDTTSRRTVGRRNFRERNIGNIGPWYPAPWCSDRRYDLRANMLVITPYESAAGVYRAYYRAAPYKWSTPTDTDRMDPQLEVYDEFVVIRAAMRALKIEEADASPWQDDLDRLSAAIRAEHTRDDEPAVLGDTEESDAPRWGY